MRARLVPEDVATLARNNFDALRLLLALLVVWSHSFALWDDSERNEPIAQLLGGVYNAGTVAVLGFFTISGFLITLSYLRSSSPVSFLRRRVLRIFPAYLVSTTLCALVVIPAFSSRPFWPLGSDVLPGLASNLLLRNYIPSSDAFGGGPVNGALWSIPYEFLCYLGILALGLVGLVRRSVLFPLMAAAVMLVRIWLDMTGRRTGGALSQLFEIVIGYPYPWFVVLPSFLLGAIVLQYRRVIPRSRTFLGLMLLALIVAAHLPVPDPLRSVITRTLLPPILAYLIFFVAFMPGLHGHNAARYGDFSYGTYLYGFPIEQMLRWSLWGRIGFPAYVGLCFAASLAAGVASWMIVERWFVRGAKRAGRHVLGEEAVIVAP